MKTYQELLENVSRDARQELKSGLAQCTEQQQFMFKRIYAASLDEHIDVVVDNMNEEKLDWAMQQVQKTLEYHS